MNFYDRNEAGRLLAEALMQYKNAKQTIVLGLARGGVVVAYEVATALYLPLNVVVPRKIGAPGNSEFAIGAIMENGQAIFNDRTIQMLRIPQSYIDSEVEKEKELARQRLALYREKVPMPDIRGQTVILVDDGIATGATMLVAIKSLKYDGVKKIIVAVPVSSGEAMRSIRPEVDEIICLHVDENLGAIGFFYTLFNQTDDSEVVKLLGVVNAT